MGMTPQDKELYRRIDEVAHYIWDPIGVSDVPYARDEYQSYLPRLFAHVKDGDLNSILEYMKSVVTERMEMSFDRERAEHAATAMLEWKEVIDERSQ